MRLLLVAACALPVLAPSASALETSRRIDDTRADSWNAGATVRITYYNICTGWIWIRSGFPARSRFGIGVDVPAAVSTLGSSWQYFYSGVPMGWGYTGTIAASVVDASGCPAGVPLASQPWAPRTGWNLLSWNAVVPDRFALHCTTGPGGGSPLAVVLDHPGPVAGGPAACGTCYPTSRVNHSFTWGTAALPLCPGEPMFHDGWCHAQLLWDFELATVDALGPATWGRIKSLYR